MPQDRDIEYGVGSVNHKAMPEMLKVILSSYDDKQSKESNLLKRLDELTIEHIMPKALTSAWKASLGPDCQSIHDYYLNKLANLTLTGYNSEMGNKSFEEKLKTGFNDSLLYINDWIKQQTTWNEEVLQEREKWWVEQINAIWPYPQEIY